MPSRNADQLIGDPRDHRHQSQSKQQAKRHALHANEEKQHDADDQHKENKAGTATLMISGGFHHVLHRKLAAAFNTVDALMLCTVILI